LARNTDYEAPRYATFYRFQMQCRAYALIVHTCDWAVWLYNLHLLIRELYCL